MSSALSRRTDVQDPFPESAEQLVGYIEIHKETPRALTHIKHILMLAYCTGIIDDELENLAQHYLIGKKIKQFISLHALSGVDEICRIVRARIKNGDVPPLWKENFNKEMDAIVKKFSIQNL